MKYLIQVRKPFIYEGKSYMFARINDSNTYVINHYPELIIARLT